MSEEKRRLNNKERVFCRLVAAGSQGVTNAQLIQDGGFRYGARLFELRQDGWIIDTVPAGEGLFKFILRGKTQDQPSLFKEMRV